MSVRLREKSSWRLRVVALIAPLLLIVGGFAVPVSAQDEMASPVADGHQGDATAEPEIEFEGAAAELATVSTDPTFTNGEVVDIGEVVSITIVVQNTGDEAFVSLAADNSLGSYRNNTTITGDQGLPLAPGDTASFTLSITVSDATTLDATQYSSMPFFPVVIGTRVDTTTTAASAGFTGIFIPRLSPEAAATFTDLVVTPTTVTDPEAGDVIDIDLSVTNNTTTHYFGIDPNGFNPGMAEIGLTINGLPAPIVNPTANMIFFGATGTAESSYEVTAADIEACGQTGELSIPIALDMWLYRVTSFTMFAPISSAITITCDIVLPPTVEPTATVEVEQTAIPTVPADEPTTTPAVDPTATTPSVDPTATATSGTDVIATPVKEADPTNGPVTKLPNTGDGSASPLSSTSLVMLCAAALLLVGAGSMRLRRRQR